MDSKKRKLELSEETLLQLNEMGKIQGGAVEGVSASLAVADTIGKRNFSK